MSKVRSATYVSIQDGDEIASILESKFNTMIEEATKSNTEAPVALRTQTFTLYEAESLADISDVCPNEQVAVDLFNRGASLKQLNEIRDLMTSPVTGDDAFEAVEGSYDLKDVIARVTERKKLSPMDKVLRSLTALTDDERQAIIQRLLQTQTS